MKYTISDDRETLTFTVTADEQAELNEIESIQSDAAMYDFFEHVTCNSELEWLYASEIGDLTDAPMIGIFDSAEKELNEKNKTLPHRVTAGDNGKVFINTITHRWAFMDYQVRSVLEDLRDTGKVVFVGGSVQ